MRNGQELSNCHQCNLLQIIVQSFFEILYHPTIPHRKFLLIHTAISSPVGISTDVHSHSILAMRRACLGSLLSSFTQHLVSFKKSQCSLAWHFLHSLYNLVMFKSSFFKAIRSFSESESGLFLSLSNLLLCSATFACISLAVKKPLICISSSKQSAIFDAMFGGTNLSTSCSSCAGGK